MVTHLHFYICVYYHIYALPLYHITTLGIVMPMNNEWPLINAGKVWILEPFPFHLLLNEASTVQESLNVGQAVAFLAADG